MIAMDLFSLVQFAGIGLSNYPKMFLMVNTELFEGMCLPKFVLAARLGSFSTLAFKRDVCQI